MNAAMKAVGEGSFCRFVKRFTILGMLLAIAAGAQTAQEIVSGWASLSGGLGGKVVFGRSDRILVMDLTTGDTAAIANFPLANTQFGLSGSYKFSPDGTRIAAQNDQALMILNADGSNQQIIWQGSLSWDLICAGWDGDSAVVYSTFAKVVRTAINADNTAGATTDLVTTPPYMGYCSVEKSGDYLCYLDIQGNVPTRGYHRTLIKNLATGVVHDMVPRNADGCTIRLRPDSSGVCMQNKANHIDPAYIQTFDTVTIDRLAPVPMQGLAGMRWSNMAEFLAHNGDRAAQAGNRADYAWIRKMSTKAYLFIGTRMYWPDLWVGTSAGMEQVALPQIAPSVNSFEDSISVSMTTATAGAEIRYTLNGIEPVITSTLYTAPLSVRATTTIKAKAFKTGMIPSNTAERYYLKARLRAPDNPMNVISGMKYRYFEGTWYSLPDFSQLTPVDTGFTDSFNISVRKREDLFGLEFTGYISIVKDDFYTFYTGSDEGSRLYIGDSLVVNNDGLHLWAERSGTIALAAGRHAIRVVYFDQLGVQYLTVSYMGGGIVKQAIPSSVLYRTTPEKSIQLVSPDGGEYYGLGDTVRIAWTFVNGAGMSAVQTLSLDDGLSFAVPLFTDAYVQTTEDGVRNWVIPRDSSLITDQARIKVYMYNNEAINDVSSGTFRIVAVNPVRQPMVLRATGMNELRIGATTIRYRLPAGTQAERAVLHGVDGTVIHTLGLVGKSTGAPAPLPAGAYIVRIVDKSGMTVWGDVVGVLK